MIDLEEKHLQEVLRILEEQAPDCEARVFGSRATGTAERFSDLDLLLIGREKLDWRKIERLKDAFSESNLPMRVDVLDRNAIKGKFRKKVESEAVPLTSAGSAPSISKRAHR
jgi:predicted nucleotidyltransferase